MRFCGTQNIRSVPSVHPPLLQMLPQYFLKIRNNMFHEDVIKCQHFPRHEPFVGESTGHRWIPLTKAIDAELWHLLWSLHLNKRVNKHSRRQWFETPLCSLWRQRYGIISHFSSPWRRLLKSFLLEKVTHPSLIINVLLVTWWLYQPEHRQT